jgi:hypothetical protein
LSISIGGVYASQNKDVVRLEMFDENGNDVPLALDFNNLSATLHEDYVGMNTTSTGGANPAWF